MRVSSNQSQFQSFNAINKHQQAIMDVQEKLSTGKRVNRPGDDPIAMNQIHSLNKSINTLTQFEKNGQFAKSQLVQEETAISGTIDGVQRARELAILMKNDTYSANDRKAAALEVGQLIEQVKNIMNYTNSEGEKLFAGNSVNATEAFVADPNNPGYFAYIGSNNSTVGAATPAIDAEANFGARFVQIGFDANNQLDAGDLGDSSRVRITDNGDRVFQVPNSTTQFVDDPAGAPPVALNPQPDANILNILVEFEKTLLAGEPPADNLVTDMDKSLTQLSDIRAEIGGRQNRIQAQYDAGQTFKVSLEERKMNIEQMDLVQGISTLTQHQNALQIAQQIFSKVQNSSLFNFIN